MSRADKGVNRTCEVKLIHAEFNNILKGSKLTVQSHYTAEPVQF